MSDIKHLFNIFIKAPKDNIIPKKDIIKESLVVVVAIMSFLCASALASVYLLNNSVKRWNSELGTEATIEIAPRDTQNIEQDLKSASELAINFPGIYDTEILTINNTKELLHPWLGDTSNYNDLPIPRIVIVHITNDNIFDDIKFKSILKKQLPNASFNNNHSWVTELKTTANNCILISGFIVLLLISSLIITIIFATLSAVNANKHIIDILHFLSADQSYIVRQFDVVFFHKAVQGALIGAIATITMFYLLFLFNSYGINHTHLYAFFGNFKLGAIYYLEMCILLVFVIILTTLTCRTTVVKQLYKLENNV